MPIKRGRPLSTDTVDEVVLHRREQQRNRVRRFRQKQTLIQRQQSTVVGETTFTLQDSDALATPPQLGLRVQDLSPLPQDSEQLIPPPLPIRRLSTSPLSSAFLLPFHTLQHGTRFSPPPTPDYGQHSDEASYQNNQNDAENTEEEVLEQEEFTFDEDDDMSDYDSPIPRETRRLSVICTENLLSQADSEKPVSFQDRDPAFGPSVGDTLDHADRQESHTAQGSPSLVLTGNESDTSSQISPEDYTVEKLYSQMFSRFQGCTEQEHSDTLDSHILATDNVDNHHGLDEILQDPNFPSVLSRPGAENLLS
jgi:hypothetical protein